MPRDYFENWPVWVITRTHFFLPGVEGLGEVQQLKALAGSQQALGQAVEQTLGALTCAIEP